MISSSTNSSGSGSASANGNGNGSKGDGQITKGVEEEVMLGQMGREGRPRRGSTAKSFASSIRTFNSSTTTGSSIDIPDTRFSALRTWHSNSTTASTSTRNQRIAIPERKKGDWACYGRVVCRVVVMQRGALGRERSRKGKIRVAEGDVEYFFEGTLWVTKVRSRPPIHLSYSHVSFCSHIG